MSSEPSWKLELTSSSWEVDPNSTWIEDLNSTSWDSEPVIISSPTSTWSSTTTPPNSPPRGVQPAHTVVNNTAGLKLMLDDIVKHTTIPPKLYSKTHFLPSKPETDLPNVHGTMPELYVDAEGISLSRSGELSILILHIETRTLQKTYLIHVHVLRRLTFNAKSTNGNHSLKTIFEDDRIAKVLYDCRMDSDALFGQYGVRLRAVIDLQLMYLATRGGGPRYMSGLEACLLNDLNIEPHQRAWVKEAKDRGQKIWRPNHGGSMERFNDNPLHEDIVNYCVVDAAYLPRLFERYNRMLGNRVSLAAISASSLSWEGRIPRLSKERAEKALDTNFTGGTAHNPWYIHNPYDDDY